MNASRASERRSKKEGNWRANAMQDGDAGSTAFCSMFNDGMQRPSSFLQTARPCPKLSLAPANRFPQLTRRVAPQPLAKRLGASRQLRRYRFSEDPVTAKARGTRPRRLGPTRDSVGESRGAR